MSIFEVKNGNLVRKDAAEASQIEYDNQTSGLTADDVQEAIDEIDGSVDTIKTDLSDLEDDMSEYHVVPSRNLLAYPYTYSGVRVNSGITFREVGNGAVSLNGTNDGTAVSEWYLTGRLPTQGAEGTYMPLYLPIGRYVFALSGQYANLCGINVAMTAGGSYVSVASAVGEPVTFEITADTACDYKLSDGSCLIGFIVNVPKNTSRTFVNDIVYPMIYTASDYAADPSYEPYWVCMRDGKLDITDEQVLGAWNMLDNRLTTQTLNGITVTVGSKKEVRVTTSSSAPTQLVNFRILPDGIGLGNLVVGKTYYLTGCPAGGAGNVYCLVIGRDHPGGSFDTIVDSGNGLQFTYDGSWTCRFVALQIGTAVGANFDKTFYPMISTKKGAPYVPYTMTNRELTETITNKTTTIISQAFTDETIYQNTGKTGDSKYLIRGGVCYLSLYVTAVAPVTTDTYVGINLPVPAASGVFTFGSLCSANGDVMMIAVRNRASDNLMMSGGVAGRKYYGTLAYPVA